MQGWILSLLLLVSSIAAVVGCGKQSGGEIVKGVPRTLETLEGRDEWLEKLGAADLTDQQWAFPTGMTKVDGQSLRPCMMDDGTVFTIHQWVNLGPGRKQAIVRQTPGVHTVELIDAIAEDATEHDHLDVIQAMARIRSDGTWTRYDDERFGLSAAVRKQLFVDYTTDDRKNREELRAKYRASHPEQTQEEKEAFQQDSTSRHKELVARLQQNHPFTPSQLKDMLEEGADRGWENLLEPLGE